MNGTQEEMLHELIELRCGEKYGSGESGLFAKGPLPAGTVVWWKAPGDVTQRRYTRKEILEHPQREKLCRFSYMTGHDSYDSTTTEQEDPAWFFNHSCDGNCWYDSDDKVVTRRDVAAGEEITYDYGLTETEASLHAGMRCRCGAASCRGTLALDQYRDPFFLREYGGHTSSFIARKARELGWHHPAVYAVRTAPECGCMGLFSLQPLAKGEVLLYLGGKVVGRAEFLRLQRLHPTPHFIQVAPALWMVPSADGYSETPDYINHSCEPNCGMMDSVTVVAMRDIAPGEELCIDYGTVMDESVEESGLESFDCTCGAAGCRRRVTPRDYRRPEVRARYQEYFPPFMRAKVAMT